MVSTIVSFPLLIDLIVPSSSMIPVNTLIDKAWCGVCAAEKVHEAGNLPRNDPRKPDLIDYAGVIVNSFGQRFPVLLVGAVPVQVRIGC